MQARHTSRVRGIFVWDTRDDEGALAELVVARLTLSNDPQLSFVTGLMLGREEHWEESGLHQSIRFQPASNQLSVLGQ